MVSTPIRLASLTGFHFAMARAVTWFPCSFSSQHRLVSIYPWLAFAVGFQITLARRAYWFPKYIGSQTLLVSNRFWLARPIGFHQNLALYHPLLDNKHYFSAASRGCWSASRNGHRPGHSTFGKFYKEWTDHIV